MIRHFQEQSPGANGTTTTSDARATQFQAVQGGGETHDGNTLMVEAYAVLWIILMGWLFLLWRKQSVLNARIDELDRVLDRAAARQGSKGTSPAS